LEAQKVQTDFFLTYVFIGSLIALVVIFYIISIRLSKVKTGKDVNLDGKVKL